MRPPEATFDAIGTRWRITTPEPLADRVLARVHAVIDAYDRTWSRFRADSVVAAMAREPGTYVLPAHAAALLDHYDVLAACTDGAVTPLVGRSLERLGYDATYTLCPAGDPVPAAASAAVSRDGHVLRVHEPVLLDVGAAGKGQLVDLVGEELLACGVGTHTVDAGGDVLHRGPTPLRVALQKPGDPTRAIGVVEVRDGAVCGSAVDRRTWGDGLHHVLDARTGAPVRDVVATWALASTAMVADGLATALFLADADRLQARYAHTYVQLHADGHARYALALPGELCA